MINRFALSFLCIELDRTRNVRGHATLYTTHVYTNNYIGKYVTIFIGLIQIWPNYINFKIKGALYRIWCGVNILGDSGVNVV